MNSKTERTSRFANQTIKIFLLGVIKSLENEWKDNEINQEMDNEININ